MLNDVHIGVHQQLRSWRGFLSVIFEIERVLKHSIDESRPPSPPTTATSLSTKVSSQFRTAPSSPNAGLESVEYLWDRISRQSAAVEQLGLEYLLTVAPSLTTPPSQEAANVRNEAQSAQPDLPAETTAHWPPVMRPFPEFDSVNPHLRLVDDCLESDAREFAAHELPPLPVESEPYRSPEIYQLGPANDSLDRSICPPMGIDSLQNLYQAAQNDYTKIRRQMQYGDPYDGGEEDGEVEEEIRASKLGTRIFTRVVEELDRRWDQQMIAMQSLISSTLNAHAPSQSLSSPPGPTSSIANSSLQRPRNTVRRGRLPLVNRKPADQNAFCAGIRRHLTDLLGGDVLNPARHATRAEREWFAQACRSRRQDDRLPCCSTDLFKIDLSSSPRSQWNISAANIFAQSYIRSQEISIDPSIEKKVKSAFFGRLKSILAAKRKMMLGDANLALSKQAERRAQRKRELFLRRCHIAATHPHLLRHMPLLEQLGIDGMSDDESDREEREELSRAGGLTEDKIQPRYLVLSPEWRAEELTNLLRDIDIVGIERRADMGIFRGSLPRLREAPPYGVRYSTSSRFVPGLPFNAYKLDWLQKQDPGILRVQPLAHNFAHGRSRS